MDPGTHVATDDLNGALVGSISSGVVVLLAAALVFLFLLGYPSICQAIHQGNRVGPDN